MTRASHLLAVDVGNSSLSLGVFVGDELRCTARIPAEAHRTSDEHAVLFRAALAGHRLGVAPSADGGGGNHDQGGAAVIDGAIVASVVPELTPVVVRAIRRAFAREPLIMGAGTRTGMPIRCESPREVGADRIANALAAFHRVRGGAIVVDFGTATVFDCVTPRGEYVGGAIAPGVKLAADSLAPHVSIARAAPIALEAPPRALSTDPLLSVQAGVVLGWASLVDGMVTRMVAELGFPCTVLATGGLANLVAPHARMVTETVPALTLEGLRLVWALRPV